MVLLRNLHKYIRFFKVFLVIIFEVSISPLRCATSLDNKTSTNTRYVQVPGTSGILSNLQVVDFLAIQEANNIRYITHIYRRSQWLAYAGECMRASQSTKGQHRRGQKCPHTLCRGLICPTLI